MGQIDKTDRRIINLMQRDADLTVAAIGERIGLSQNACWRRIKKLEEHGIIKERRVLFDAEKIGYPLTVYALIRVREHDSDSLASFDKLLLDTPEIVEFHRMSGDLDYLAKIIAKDVKHYDLIYKKVIGIGFLTDVSSSFLMEEIKSSTAVPIDC